MILQISSKSINVPEEFQTFPFKVFAPGARCAKSCGILTTMKYISVLIDSFYLIAKHFPLVQFYNTTGNQKTASQQAIKEPTCVFQYAQLNNFNLQHFRLYTNIFSISNRDIFLFSVEISVIMIVGEV